MSADHGCCGCHQEEDYEAGRRSMRDDIRRWLEGKSAGVTPGRLLEDLDEQVPADTTPDPPASETTEQDHPHECPRCGDTWLHADDACQVIHSRASYANCPICRED